jgi:diadenosine tetraphosphate (Ap4A) HIT family hydrolase
VYADEHVVAFLSRYPTLLGYTIVAPRAHVVDVTGDRELFRLVTDVVHDVAEALKATVPMPEDRIGPMLRAVLERHARYLDMSTREALWHRT